MELHREANLGDTKEVAPVQNDALVFTGSDFERIRQLLLAERVETALFLLANPVRTPKRSWRLLVREIIEVDPSTYKLRTSSAIELPPAVIAGVMHRARASGQSIIVAHSHPTGGARPSPVDTNGESSLIAAFRRRIPGLPHGRLIVSKEEQHSAIFPPALAGSIEERPLALITVGANVLSFPTVANAIASDQTPNTTDKPNRVPNDYSVADTYDRQLRAFGQGGQRVLQDLRVAIVGLGGTGSIVSQQLAHLGVNKFVLIDPDVVDESNLNRIVGASHADVGRNKVDVASDLIHKINPTATTEEICSDVCLTETARRLLDTDVFFSCTDSHGSRWILTQLAYQYWIPGIDIGVAIQVQAGIVTHIAGRVQMLSPGLSCLACGELLDPELVRRDLLTQSQRMADPYIIGAAVPQPAVISINGVASSLAVTMFLSAFAGMPMASRYQQLRLESGMVSRIHHDPRPDCVVCSQEGLFGLGDKGGPLGRPEDAP